MGFLINIIVTLCILSSLSFSAVAVPNEKAVNWLDRLEAEPVPNFRIKRKSPAAVQPLPNFVIGYAALRQKKYEVAEIFFKKSNFEESKSMLAYMYIKKLGLNHDPDFDEIDDLLQQADTPVAKANRARLILAGQLVIKDGTPQIVGKVAGDLLKESGTESAKKDLEELKKAGLYESDCGCCDCVVQ
jgi:hypothetical protein